MFGCERKSVSVKWMQSEAIKVVTAAFLSFMLISHHLHIHPNATVCSMSPLTHTHARTHNKEQRLLACGVITPAGETQTRRARVISVCVALCERRDLKRATCTMKQAFCANPNVAPYGKKGRCVWLCEKQRFLDVWSILGCVLEVFVFLIYLPVKTHTALALTKQKTQRLRVCVCLFAER